MKKLTALTLTLILLFSLSAVPASAVSIFDKIYSAEFVTEPVITARELDQHLELMDEFDLTQEELSERLGKSRSAVANTLRLLNLAPEVSVLVADGKLSAGHARALITIPKNKQRAFADKIIAEDMSVRAVEKLVRNYLTPPEEKHKPKASISKELRDMVDRMQRSFGTKVTAIGNDNKGRIYVDYYTRDDLERIYELLVQVEKIKK